MAKNRNVGRDVKPRPDHVYVHAIVSGRPTPRALSRLPMLPDGSPPRSVALADDMSLVVADVPSETYNAATLEAKLGDLDWVSQCGAAHHAVADALVASHVVLPFRIFTLFSSEAKAVATLRKSQARILEALARVKGRQEWVLRIGRPDLARQDSPPNRPRRQHAPDSKSGTGFLQAKAEARHAQAQRRARVAGDVAKVFETLRDASDEAAVRPIAPGTTLLLEAAFLLPQRRVTELRRALTKAAANLLREGCAVSLTGPWPPYSFASLDKANG